MLIKIKRGYSKKFLPPFTFIFLAAKIMEKDGAPKILNSIFIPVIMECL